MVGALRVINVLGREEKRDEGDHTVVSDPKADHNDVSGDGRTSALDALLIINHLTRQHLIEDSVDSVIQAADDDDDRFAAIDLVLNDLL